MSYAYLQMDYTFALLKNAIGLSRELFYETDSNLWPSHAAYLANFLMCRICFRFFCICDIGINTVRWNFIRNVCYCRQIYSTFCFFKYTVDIDIQGFSACLDDILFARLTFLQKRRRNYRTIGCKMLLIWTFSHVYSNI